jgi:NADPH-dependent curcumin reductase CurA
MLGWDQYRFDNISTGSRYAEHVFLHPLGPVGHVVQSGVSGVQNGDVLFSMPGWDRYRFDKKCDKTHYVELVFLDSVGYAGHVVHSRTSRD